MVKIASRFGTAGMQNIIQSSKKDTPASIPASQHTGKPAPPLAASKQGNTSKPVNQHASMQTKKQKAAKIITSMPVSQYAGKKIKDKAKATSQHTSKPVSQHASKGKGSNNTSIPAGKYTSMLTKATFYLYPEQIIELEKIRLNHLTARKAKTDKSELVRQAIDMLVDRHAGSKQSKEL